MSQPNDIEQAFDNAVDAFCIDNDMIGSTGHTSVVFQGVAFNPNIHKAVSGDFSQMYLECNFLPATNRMATLGRNSCDREDGIYQISINEKSGRGVIKTKALERKLLQYFPIQSKFTYNNATATVISNSPAPRNDNDVWITTPISIEYRAYTQRS